MLTHTRGDDRSPSLSELDLTHGNTIRDEFDEIEVAGLQGSQQD